MSESSPNRPHTSWASRIVLLAVVAACAVWWLARRGQNGPLASVALTNGKILHVEKVSFGTKDRIGQHDYYNQFFHWLPVNLGRFLAPWKGESTVNLPNPALIVWVDATDARTGKDVDAQGIRLELVDRNGELWGEQTHDWSGFQNSGPKRQYSRMAFIFDSFPRDEKTLTLRCTPSKQSAFGQVEFKNPCFTAPAVWTGLPLPQRKAVGEFEILLTALALATNGGPKEYWTTPARYWKPSWQLLRDGLPASGWDEAEWEAEDPLGNRSQTPNVRQPVLRFSASFHPSATNLAAAVLVAALPKIDLTSSVTNWWNATNRFQSNEIEALGFFPPGTYVFCNGQFTNYNPGLGPTGGGAPSGWESTSRYVGAGRMETFRGHYTPSPVIYLRYKEDDFTGRIAVRFRDEQGGCWIATPEAADGREVIHPFMLKPPAGVKIVTPEIVCLKPIKASFLVEIPALP